MADMYDQMMDAVTAFADGCNKMTERMDSLEKRRADSYKVYDAPSHAYSALDHHMKMAVHHHTESMKGGPNSFSHKNAAKAHMGAAGHYGEATSGHFGSGAKSRIATHMKHAENFAKTAAFHESQIKE